MLVFSRKSGEKAYIKDAETGQVIEILIARIERGQVRIGVNASQRFEVRREELVTPDWLGVKNGSK